VTRSGAHKSYHPPLGFEQVHRHWDSTAKAWIVHLLPGEFFVTSGPEIIATVLGSCVSTCMRDPRSGLGGMNHFMLPDDPRKDAKGDALRYGCFAVERLINELLKGGAQRARLEIKVFGGGRVLAGLSDIGNSNIAFVRNYLREEQLEALVEDVGGTCARRVRYFPSTGKVLVKHLAMREAAKIGTREEEFRNKLKTGSIAGEVELF
jgi:chemotaxis protein CheD